VVEGGSLEGGVLMNIERDIASFTLRAAISEHEPTAAPVDQRCGVFYVDRPARLGHSLRARAAAI